MFTMKQSVKGYYDHFISNYKELLPDGWTSKYKFSHIFGDQLKIYNRSGKKVVYTDNGYIFIHETCVAELTELFNIPEFHYEIFDESDLDYEQYDPLNDTPKYLTFQVFNDIISSGASTNSHARYLDYHYLDNDGRVCRDFFECDKKYILDNFKKLVCVKFYGGSNSVIDMEFIKLLFKKFETLRWVFVDDTEYSIDSQQENDFDLRVAQDYCEYVGSTRPYYMFSKNYSKMVFTN